MKHPADACRLAAYALYGQKVYAGKGIADSDADFQGLCMRPADRFASFTYKELEVAEPHVRAYVPQDLVPEREILSERDWGNLRKIGADRRGAEQLVVAMPHNSTEFNFEEAIRKVSGGNAPELDYPANRFSQIVMVFARPKNSLQLPAIPPQLADFQLTGRPRTKHEFLAVPDSRESSNAAKPSR